MAKVSAEKFAAETVAKEINAIHHAKLRNRPRDYGCGNSKYYLSVLFKPGSARSGRKKPNTRVFLKKKLTLISPILATDGAEKSPVIRHNRYSLNLTLRTSIKISLTVKF